MVEDIEGVKEGDVGEQKWKFVMSFERVGGVLGWYDIKEYEV